MNNLNLKLNFGSYAGIIIIAFIFAAILMKESLFQMIIDNTGSNQIEESRRATAMTTELLLSLDKINLDTRVLTSDFLQSLQALPEFPIDAQTLTNFGKTNPFLGNFIVVAPTATSSVGGVVYSAQRSRVNGQVITPTTR